MIIRRLKFTTVEPILYGWSLSGHLPFKATKFDHHYDIIKTLTTKSLFRPFPLHKQSHLKNSFAKKVNILLNNLQSFRKNTMLAQKHMMKCGLTYLAVKKCTPITDSIYLCVWRWCGIWCWYRSGTVNSNTVNSKFHLIRSYCKYLATILSFHV